jgi:cyanate permease
MRRYVVKESHTMILSFLPQFLMLFALSFFSFNVFKKEDTKNYFILALVWSVVALIGFCFSIMMFFVSNIYLGFTYALVFPVSIYISMKFRNAVKTT